jgi:hypothetical protein
MVYGAQKIIQNILDYQMHIQRTTQQEINPIKSTANSNNNTLNITDIETFIKRLSNRKSKNTKITIPSTEQFLQGQSHLVTIIKLDDTS